MRNINLREVCLNDQTTSSVKLFLENANYFGIFSLVSTGTEFGGDVFSIGTDEDFVGDSGNFECGSNLILIKNPDEIVSKFVLESLDILRSIAPSRRHGQYYKCMLWVFFDDLLESWHRLKAWHTPCFPKINQDDFAGEIGNGNSFTVQGNK